MFEVADSRGESQALRASRFSAIGYSRSTGGALEADSSITARNGISTLAEQLFHTLSEAILQGTLAPGAKISEPVLARRYGVSRGPLREALHRLQERRLITRSANHGARVVELSARGLAEIFLVREALEGIAAREASIKATPDERAALRAVVVRHKAELEGLGDRDCPDVTANRDFHFLIARASRNPLLIQLLCDELYPLLRLYRGRVPEPPERSWRAYEEHERIVHAVEDRDSELAELLMRRHVCAARVRRERELASDVTPRTPLRRGRLVK
jgi:DNA-binding GntR family transcriptional regulator